MYSINTKQASVPGIVLHDNPERGSDDGKACGLNGFGNTCMFSPKQLQQEKKAISEDQSPSIALREFLVELGQQPEDFLNLWNEGPDKETILLSEKIVYPDVKNIGKQINITMTPPASSVSKSDHEQQKRNIDFDKKVKAEQEIKAARKLQSRKRTHSTMSSESKKPESDSSNKDAQQPAKKKQTKENKSSLKRSSEKDSSRKSEAASNKKKVPKKYCKAMRERILELFGSCSSDEESV